MSELTYVNDANFQEKVLGSSTPVLVDFFADWCAPCKMIEPWVEKVAKEYEGKIKVYKVNVDESPMVASSYHIMSIPTILIFNDGKPAKSIVGAVPYKVLVDNVEKILEQ